MRLIILLATAIGVTFTLLLTGCGGGGDTSGSGTPIATKINPKDGAVMVWVPAGQFSMGTPTNASNGTPYGYLTNECPQHTVYLDGYWIYKYEVTVAQFRQFCQETGYDYRFLGDGLGWDWYEPDWGWVDNHPMVNISGADAQAYASWAGVQVPTEAQWEKAARGTDKRIYPWGNAWDPAKCANWSNSGQGGSTHHGTWPVGSFAGDTSPYGVMDMAGNASEWCSDRYQWDYYSTSPSSNPTGPATGDNRVIRGNGWNRPPVDQGYTLFRCANRDDCAFQGPAGWSDDYGFRCVSTIPGP